MLALPVQNLVDELSRLPGIGQKTAQRLAFHLLKVDKAGAMKLAEAIRQMRELVRFCTRCFNFATEDLCNFCQDPRRDGGVICVVEEAPDIVPVERTGAYRGLYHVLGGALSPIDGIGPGELKVRELVGRLDSETIKEVIVATNPNTEGEATALFLAREIGNKGVRVTRIASGLPVGGDLEYADEVTLGRALDGRRELEL